MICNLHKLRILVYFIDILFDLQCNVFISVNIKKLMFRLINVHSSHISYMNMLQYSYNFTIVNSDIMCKDRLIEIFYYYYYK